MTSWWRPEPSAFAELRQHASRYLDKVKAAETVEVTERNGECWWLCWSPPLTATTARARLITASRLKPADGPLSPPRRRCATSPSAAVLREEW